MRPFLCLEHLCKFTMDGYKFTLCLEHLCKFTMGLRCSRHL